jgi:uncharacterized SAM-binding protein YcdF (DUF218 family)
LADPPVAAVGPEGLGRDDLSGAWERRVADVKQAVIVIFGAAVRPDGTPSTTLRRRVEAAVALGLRLGEVMFIPTGARGRFGNSEASVIASLLRRFGVPAERIVLEESGRDTLSSVRAVKALLRARGHAGAVYVATSAYHLPRCLTLLRLAGVAARACPPPAFPAAQGWRARWYWRVREVLAFPVDFALMLLLKVCGRV